MKIKTKLENRLREFLEKILGIKFLRCRLDILESENIKKTKQINQLEKELDLIKSTMDIAVDVHERTDSWAVVCIAGKKEYVKFVRLEQRDARDVMRFLRGFEKANSRLIDAPYPFVDCFKW